MNDHQHQAGGPTRATTPTMGPDAVFVFQAGTHWLAEGDRVWMRHWLASWNAGAPDAHIVVGCAGLEPGAMHSAGLQAIGRALVDGGIDAARIHLIDEPLQVPIAEAGAWLRVVPPDLVPSAYASQAVFGGRTILAA